MSTFRLESSSTFELDSRSTVHPIHWKAEALVGELEATITDGAIALDPQPRGHFEFQAQSLRSGVSLYDNQLPRSIDARRYPTIRGEVRAVAALSTPGQYRVRGDVTFHGVTRSTEGELQASMPDERTLILEGEQEFDIRDFGLKPPRVLMIKVFPNVRARIRLVGIRAT